MKKITILGILVVLFTAALAVMSISIATQPNLESNFRLYKIITFSEPVVDEDSSTRELVARVYLGNIADIDLEDVKVTVSIPELGIWKKSRSFDIDSDEEKIETIVMELTEEAPAGEYDIRVTISNDLFRRVRHGLIVIE